MSGTGRRLRTARGFVVAAALALAAGACGGEFTGADDGLREREAGDLASVMARQASRVMLAQVVEAPRPELGVEISSEVLFDRGAACPHGGRSAVTGRVARRSPAGDDRMTLDFRASLVHDSCAVRLGDRTVTIAGAPAVGLEARFERRGPDLDGPQETRLDGRIRWSGPRGAEAACEVDLTTVLSVEEGSLAAAGRVCGIQVDRTVGVRPPTEDSAAGTPSG